MQRYLVLLRPSERRRSSKETNKDAKPDIRICQEMKHNYGNVAEKLGIFVAHFSVNGAIHADSVASFLRQEHSAKGRVRRYDNNQEDNECEVDGGLTPARQLGATNIKNGCNQYLTRPLC